MKVYTVEQVAELLKVHPVTVRDWLRDGTLKGKKIGRRWYVTEETLKAHLEANGHSE